jgi:hypothetical protein
MSQAYGEELDEGVIGDASESILPDSVLDVGAPAEDGEEKAVEVVFSDGR